MKLMIEEPTHVAPAPITKISDFCYACNQRRAESDGYCKVCGPKQKPITSTEWRIAGRAAFILVVVILAMIGLFTVIRFVWEAR